MENKEAEKQIYVKKYFYALDSNTGKFKMVEIVEDDGKGNVIFIIREEEINAEDY